MPLEPADQSILESLWTNATRRIHEGRLQKLCRACGEWINLEQLAKCRTKNGRSARCKPCENAREGLRRSRNEAADAEQLARVLAPFKRKAG